MSNSSFSYWCRLATSEIRYKPDRDMVYKELEQHMYERYDSYIAQGFDHKEATRLTMEAMGSATKVAAQMGDIHRPFWGYLFRTCRFLFFALLILCILFGRDYLRGINPILSTYREFDTYSINSYGEGSGRTLLHLSHPGDTFSTDGSIFELIDAAVFTEIDDFTGKERTRLYARIRHTNLIPHQEYRLNPGIYDPIATWFVIKDDLGNEYALFERNSRTTGVVQSGIFFCVYECWILDFDPDAQWANICYERDGRRYALHIDITGGEAS